MVWFMERLGILQYDARMSYILRFFCSQTHLLLLATTFEQPLVDSVPSFSYSLWYWACQCNRGL